MKSKTSRKSTRNATDPTLPSHEEITARAYDLYLERGGIDGYALEDWLRAEEELLELHSIVVSSGVPMVDAEGTNDHNDHDVPSTALEESHRMVS